MSVPSTKKRPASVTIIVGILIFINLLSLLGSIATIKDPTVHAEMAKSFVPIPIQHTVSFLIMAVSILCAVFMLRGANWSRVLYFAVGAVGWLFGFLVASQKLWVIPGVVIYAVIVFILTRPKVSAYFAISENSIQ